MAQYFNAFGAVIGTNSKIIKSFYASANQQVLNGTSSNDALWDETKVGVTLAGGAGNDTYYITSGTNKIIEQASGGDDTIVTWMSYSLPKEIEHLVVNADLRYGYGNDLDNIISGDAGRQTLDGGAGNDVLIGGGGSDTFSISKGNGSDVIVDFQGGTGGDVVRLTNYGFSTLASVRNAMTQMGADVKLALGNGEILIFRNQTVSQFTSDNFALSIDTSGMRLLFSDEFNTNLSLLNGSSGTWKTTYYWGDRTLGGNKEQQFYVDPTYKSLGLNPFSVADGALTITAQRASPEVQAQISNLPYTSGVITSEQSFSMQYGYFEMRAELPAGQGLWPAFWMLPINGDWPPELDIMEVLGNDPTMLYTTVHTKETGSHKSVGLGSGVADTSSGYHSYGVKWTAEKITWYFDGVKVFESATPADLHQPMYMIANLAVGGWAGSPGADSIFPAEMKIDYIRAYQLPVDHSVVTEAPATWVPLSQLTFGTVDGTGAPVVWSYSNTMSATQQKMKLGSDWSRIASGNALDNWIEGGVGQYQEYDGNGGNDVLKGGAGTDVFKIQNGDGNDTILDFSNVPGNRDKVYLDGFHFRHFEDVKPFLTQVGADVFLRLDADQALKFANITIDKLSAEQFAFFNPVSLANGPTLTATQPVTSTQTTNITQPVPNRVATITGDFSRTIIEDSAAVLKASGKLTVSDLDPGEAGVQSGTLTSALGTFVITADGSWSYSADNALSSIQSLNNGQQLIDTFEVQSIDGSAHTSIAITIQGLNEAPLQPLQTKPTPAINAHVLNSKGKALPFGAAPTKSLYASGSALSGTSNDDALWGKNDVKTVMAGGAGDDLYYVKTPQSKVSEHAGGGIDTVYTWMSYTLSSNVENLTLMAKGVVGTGNALDNIMIGSSGSQTFDGRGGNDVLKGGSGRDFYKFHKSSGHDLVLDFQDARSGDQDIIMVSKGLFADFKAVRKASSVIDADKDGRVDDVFIKGPAQSLVLLNTKMAMLGADDFRFF
ncbi:family 16 glycosylhydrolase [Microvirga terrae]|uniref:Family 16 glycosylhydrolase n=1 Tax=Microvirga terrae TaxID=2740529 RepID=A0ABY5RN25_9HYPH|nr:family 16 glycosylhydrolase [Microvirga terrae]UVF18388.1 family 16 glycosylhydrolase [Microvirga terrae]